jgi:hypothetical protein
MKKKKKTFEEWFGASWNEIFWGSSIIICFLLFVDLWDKGLFLQASFAMVVAMYLFYKVGAIIEERRTN